MHLTPFGWIFLPIVIALLVWRRDWLPALLPVAACLHAPAVAIVGSGGGAPGYGITPWHVTCLALALHLLPALPQFRQRYLQLDQRLRWLFLGWTVFVILSVLSAFTLPFLFSGMQTYNNAQTVSIAVGTFPLSWRIGNAVQAANLLIIWVMLLYGVLIRPSQNFARIILRGFVVAAVLSVTASLAQRGLVLAGIDPFKLTASSLNPGYHNVIGHIYAWTGLRMGWPFSEASYASAWFAALAIAGAGAWLLERSRTGLTLLIVGMIGMTNSFSATGTAAALVAGTGIWLVSLAQWHKSGKPAILRRNVKLVLALMAALLIAAIMVSRVQLAHPELGAKMLTQATVNYIDHKIHDNQRSGNTRWKSNVRAVEITMKSGGLGVGLGSNRASNYVLNLVSNVGLLPATLFALLCMYQLLLLIKRDTEKILKIIVLWGTLCMALAVTIGIPDLLWPAWWVWLILTFWILCWRTIDAPQALRV